MGGAGMVRVVLHPEMSQGCASFNKKWSRYILSLHVAKAGGGGLVTLHRVRIGYSVARA